MSANTASMAYSLLLELMNPVMYVVSFFFLSLDVFLVPGSNHVLIP